MRFKNVLLCLGLGASLAFFGLAACSDDDGGNGGDCGNGVCDANEDSQSCPEDCYCGNGSIDPGEECDGADLGGATCLDSDINCTGGILGCTDQCSYDVSRCTGCQVVCGDGIVDGDEECDDGNTEDGDGCDSSCMWESECGNGDVEGDEECDDGNTDNGDGCDENCMEEVPCATDPWNVCDPTVDGDCCPDMYGTEYTCNTEGFTQPICIQECGDTSECYYNMYCESMIAGGACYFALCGPGQNAPITAQFNGPCTVPGGEEGICMPLGPAEDETGICVEDGAGAQGDACDYVEESSIDLTYQPRSMDWDRCDNGFCGTDGTCVELCNWEDTYTGSETCASGFTCLPYSTIYVHDPSDPNSVEDYDGLRWAETSYCVERDLDPAAGIITCDLLTGEVLPDRGDTCSQFDDTDNTYSCQPIYFGGDEFGWGTPLGWCTTLTETPSKTMWETCDPSADLCEEGTFCFPEDTTDFNSQGRCLPYCDTGNDDCGSRPGLPADSECHSVSAWYNPGSTQGSTQDGSPSTLGFCGCPDGGCTGGVCGNDTIEGSEVCDGTDVPDCTDYGFAGGTMGCNATCDATDPSGCTN